jgi:DNA polymerase sigma
LYRRRQEGRGRRLRLRVEAGINKVHTIRGKEAAMSIIKTAISLPEPLFEKADAFARQQKISRSQLFVRAVEEFLRRHESQALLQALNHVYEGISPSPEEKEVRRLMQQKQREMVKGEW